MPEPRARPPRRAALQRPRLPKPVRREPVHFSGLIRGVWISIVSPIVARDTKRRQASGRFVLRLDPGLHAALREAARAAELSLNDYCATKLAAPAGMPAPSRALAAVVQRAAQQFGADLLAVAAYGSWARDELHDASDVDVLVVLESHVPLRRALYRVWDEEPLWCDGRRVEAHLAHLPPPNETVAGIWSEVAIDGIVLFERGLQLSSRLVRVRHDIVAGRIVRRTVHGQGYWVHEVA